MQAAKEILGTRTLTDTVDAALSEVVKRRQRQELLKLLSTPGALALDDREVMAGAWRQDDEGPRTSASSNPRARSTRRGRRP